MAARQMLRVTSSVDGGIKHIYTRTKPFFLDGIEELRKTAFAESRALIGELPIGRACVTSTIEIYEEEKRQGTLQVVLHGRSLTYEFTARASSMGDHG